MDSPHSFRQPAQEGGWVMVDDISSNEIQQSKLRVLTAQIVVVYLASSSLFTECQMTSWGPRS
jgi:hypothetical protein